MDRLSAAAMLGLPADADRQAIQRAWRLWARSAHPDVGGDRLHFDRLRRARDVLLEPVPAIDGGEEPSGQAVQPAAPLRSLIHPPAHMAAVITCGLLVIVSAGLPRVLLDAPLVLTVLPSAAGAALWAFMAQRAVLERCADTGQRMLTVTALWLPTWVAQLLLATVLGTEVLVVLPLTVVPLAAVISMMNLGAGLWRPARARNR